MAQVVIDPCRVGVILAERVVPISEVRRVRRVGAVDAVVEVASGRVAVTNRKAHGVFFGWCGVRRGLGHYHSRLFFYIDRFFHDHFFSDFFNLVHVDRLRCVDRLLNGFSVHDLWDRGRLRGDDVTRGRAAFLVARGHRARLVDGLAAIGR